jgi:hypothetical protein
VNYLIAKKKRTNNTYFLVLSQSKRIYELPSGLLNTKKYDANYKLESDEWYCLEHFKKSSHAIPLIQKDFNSAENHQLKKDNYKLVKFFCSFQDDDDFCFQRFTFSNIISKKWISISDEPQIKENEPILILKSTPDAIYRVSTDTLYFRNLSDIKSIFPEISELYKEATDEETEAFLINDFITLKEDFGKNQVNTANRKRISMVMETLKTLKPEEQIKIHLYIRDYCPELEFSEKENSFTIGNEEQLKNLIFGIEQRFYTTIVGKERRLADSILKL